MPITTTATTTLPTALRHRLLTLSALGFLSDTVDLLCITFLLPQWTASFGWTEWQVGWLVSASFLGQLVGGLAVGAAADRHGRLPIFRWAPWVVVVGQLLTATCPGVYWQMAVWRFVTGVGMSGAGIDWVMMIECLPDASVHLVAWLIMGGVCGVFYTGLAGWVCFQWAGTLMDAQWRWRVFLLVVTVPNAVNAIGRWLGWRWESPKYLAMRGQISPTNDNVNHDDMVAAESLLTRAVPTETPAPIHKWRLVVTLALHCAHWFLLTYAYHGIGTRLALFLANRHLPISIYENYMLLCVGQVPGWAITVWWMRRLGVRYHRHLLVVALLWCAAMSAIFAWSPSDSPSAIILASTVALYACVTSAWTLTYIHTPSCVPVPVRAFGFAVARVGAMVAGMVVGPLSGWLLDGGWSDAQVISVFGGGFGAAVVVVMMHGPSGDGKVGGHDDETRVLL